MVSLEFKALTNHEEDEVNSLELESALTYDDLFVACEELNDETIRLRKIISSYKKSIYLIESKIDIVNKDMQVLKEKLLFVTETSCTSCENKSDEVFKCDDCSVLKNKIED